MINIVHTPSALGGRGVHLYNNYGYCTGNLIIVTIDVCFGILTLVTLYTL